MKLNLLSSQAKMPFDANKLYCSEILAILLQNNDSKSSSTVLFLLLSHKDFFLFFLYFIIFIFTFFPTFTSHL